MVAVVCLELEAGQDQSDDGSDNYFGHGTPRQLGCIRLGNSYRGFCLTFWWKRHRRWHRTKNNDIARMNLPSLSVPLS